MTEQTKFTTKVVNELLGITDSYQAPDTLMKILFHKEERERLFRAFLEVDTDVSFDWFHEYFQDEHADRKKKKQDFTPQSVSKLLSELTYAETTHSYFEVAAGTGGLLITAWDKHRKCTNFFEYCPSMFFYQVEELSDRTVPFLLFNMMIRGMNGTVVHGDSLTREIKQIYFVQNDKDDFLGFSSLNVMPHNSVVTQEFNVAEWIEDGIDHVESYETFIEGIGSVDWDELAKSMVQEPK